MVATSVNINELLNDALNRIQHQIEEEPIMTAMVNGNRIAMPPPGPARWLRKTYPHEPGTAAAFIALCENFHIETVWDVGSLYGYFSVLSARIVPEAQVYAFEMNRSSARSLQRTVDLNNLKNIQVINKGASDRSATVKASVRHFILTEDTGEEDVEVIALDDFKIPPSLVKLDTEGYQAKIIPGMMNTLRKSKPLLITEFDKAEVIGRFNTTNANVFQPLLDLGYQVFWNPGARGMNGKFRGISEFSEEHERNTLMVFVHPDGPRPRTQP